MASHEHATPTTTASRIADAERVYVAAKVPIWLIRLSEDGKLKATFHSFRVNYICMVVEMFKDLKTGHPKFL